MLQKISKYILFFRTCKESAYLNDFGRICDTENKAENKEDLRSIKAPHF